MVTYKWIGGENGHYMVYKDTIFVESCDANELSEVLARLKEQ